MFQFVLNVVFPKRCVGCRAFGSYLCPNCFSTISFSTFPICPVCNKGSIDGATHPPCRSWYAIDGLTSGVVYKGVIKRLVYKFKYPPYIKTLKEAVVALLYEALIQNEVFYRISLKSHIVIPVPLSKKKERQRGYNQASILGRALAEQFSLQFADHALLRVRDTKPQFSLDKKQRLENIKGVFAINKKQKEKIQGKHILLVDDLATSCATVNECASVLKRNGAKFVWGTVFARE